MWRFIGISLVFIIPSVLAFFKGGGYYTRKDRWTTKWTTLSIIYCCHSIISLLVAMFWFLVGIINNSAIVIVYPPIFIILGLSTFLSMNSDTCTKDKIEEYINNLKEKE